MSNCPTAYRYFGKEQNSKFKVWFLPNAYHFHTTMKLNNCKFNQLKTGPSVLKVGGETGYLICCDCITPLYQKKKNSSKLFFKVSAGGQKVHCYLVDPAPSACLSCNPDTVLSSGKGIETRIWKPGFCLSSVSFWYWTNCSFCLGPSFWSTKQGVQAKVSISKAFQQGCPTVW